MGKRQSAVKTATAGLIGAAGLMLAGGITAHAKTITVKSGDTVWDIANKYGVSVKSLEQLNHVKQSNKGVDQIFAGQKIVLPGSQRSTKSTTTTTTAVKKTVKVAKASAAAKKVATVTKKTTKSTTYTVKSGDSLSKIGAKYGVTINQLKRWNNLKSNFIYAGEKLAVSGTAAKQSTAKKVTTTKKTKTKKADLMAGTSVTSVTGLAVKLASMSIPYVWGGSSLSGMDCSGLVSYVYNHAAGVSLPHNTVSQEAKVSKHSVANAKPGDILFWGSAGSTYHDAIYIGNNQYVAAPQPGQNVDIETISQYFMPSFAGTVTGA